MPIHIMNLRKASSKNIPHETMFKVDRTSPVGNPFQITPLNTRWDVCKNYELYFPEMLALNGAGKKYVDKMIEAYKKHGMLYLYCWCAPKLCHAETIKRYILEKCK